jgi:hypothetical protein
MTTELRDNRIAAGHLDELTMSMAVEIPPRP